LILLFKGGYLLLRTAERESNMKIIILNIFLGAALFSTNLFAGSIEIFKQENPNGTVEFSDQPSRGAQKIQVDPNVVEVTPAPPIEPSPPAEARSSKKSANENVDPQVIHLNSDDETYINNRRVIRKRGDGKQPSIQPLPVRKPVRVTPRR
jgi:hypothetical protein